MTIKLQEITGDAFALHKEGSYDAACVTTNGVLRKNGSGIMGAGVAKDCKLVYPEAEASLGREIKANGNITQVIIEDDKDFIIAFPTKNHWRDKSDLELIKRSCLQLMDLINKHDLKRVLLPKPGCSNGGLNWNDVRSEITPLLDERVIIISKY